MVFEVLYPHLDFKDETIQKICGIFETNAIEVRLALATEIHALYETTSLLEHNCTPNVKFSFDDKYNVGGKVDLSKRYLSLRLISLGDCSLC